ncbi:MAG: hypothetical protein ACJ75J_17155 [Cytophagaceae bacterium]
MKSIYFLIFSFVMLSCHIGNAQTEKGEFYFVTSKDTTYCQELSYGTTGQGYLDKLEYTDLSGKKVLLKGRKNVPDVLTFYMKGEIIDKTPLKANAPDGYIRYTDRVVDGKLKVYLAQQGYNNTIMYNPATPPGMSPFSTGGPSGLYRFYIKMPDGTYYKINNAGNMKKYIKPYLLQCSAFKNQYKGDFSTHEEPFMEMIRLYNSVCK